MKIYDISQEVYSCNVFPGDPVPECEKVLEISKGAVCNLTKIHMCAHNGTHLDAPKHFYDNGNTIDNISPEKFVGYVYVVKHDGNLSGTDMEKILDKITDKITGKQSGSDIKLIFKGNTIVSIEAAKVMNNAGVSLVGVESQTVGPFEAPAEVHYELLGRDVVLLEGLVLDDVSEGEYFLSALPLKLGQGDGSPCRAVLIDFD